MNHGMPKTNDIMAGYVGDKKSCKNVTEKSFRTTDVDLVPSHWKEVKGVGRDCDKPNVKFDKSKKTKKTK